LVDGAVELQNDQGTLQVSGGELARVVPGQAPTKTALIDAISIIQWCLYYPAVADVGEINFSPTEAETLRESLAQYRAGDLLRALAAFRTAQVQPTDASQTYEAALQLSVGQVAEAQARLEKVPGPAPVAQALRKQIAAVQGKAVPAAAPPALASEWLAESYSLQAQGQLEGALKAARAAVAQRPEFGFAWARVAELEFSFAHTTEAQAALDNALKLSPRNAQALALRGFLAAARDQTDEAITWFDQAIAADGALGNAWLGRGLCRIRRGEAEEGRKDLQAAAALEPQRALLRSYLGKAYAQTGKDALAAMDLRRAKELDPNDPTAWLYSAVLNQQRNRINDATRDLETSQALNDNQKIFRSRLLLDQDRAVRGANLAAIYRDAGMQDVGLREALKAVNYDYANYSAHLFLANSYDAMRDPKLFELRYETPARSEWLIANLLSPVGAGTLSRNVSQQDYARLFERDRLGFSSATEYLSRGAWMESASLFGNSGKVGYALDGSYRTDPGQRPNNDAEQLQLSAQIKVQLSPQDSVFFWAEHFDRRSGDLAQYYGHTNFNPGLRVTEKQEPNLSLGYHREWVPGLHTLFLAARIDDTLTLAAPGIERSFFKFGSGPTNPPTSILSRPFDLAYQSEFEAYSVELQQIWEKPTYAFFFGGRYQNGSADTQSRLTEVPPGPGFAFPPIQGNNSTDMDRLTFYGYGQWQVFEPVRLTAGLTYDRLHYPRNIDTSPISGQETTKDQLGPKAGLLVTPWKDATLRGQYSRSLGGLFQDNSLRLEPTEIAGFNQAFRSLIPESVEGLVPGAQFDTAAVGLDQRLRSGTYLGVDAEWRRAEADRLVGFVTSTRPFVEPNLPYASRQTLRFEEKSLLFTVNQLLCQEWSVGARYRIGDVSLHSGYPDVPAGVPNFSQLQLARDEAATLHVVNLSLNYNHPCGFFGQFASVWTGQSNRGYTPDRPGDDFWQHNLFVGYRFPHRKAELRVGVLNLTGRDYALNPLTLNTELPRSRTFVAAAKFNF